MKKLVLFLLCLSFSNLFSQSELLIPRDAVTVFSINNVSLLQKISMDELVQYDFMEEASMEEASKNSFYVSQREGYAHAYAQSCRIPTECQRHAYALPTCLGLFFNRSNSAFAES